MKKTVLLFTLILFPALIFSQEIERNEVDEFTGKQIIETSWELLTKDRKSNIASYSRFRKVDNVLFFDVRMILPYHDFFTVEEGKVFYIKFSDGEVLKFRNNNLAFSGIGDGAVGLSGSQANGVYLSFNVINDSSMQKLRDSQIEKIRLYTTDGYMEAEVKEKYSENMNELMSLISGENELTSR